MRPRYIIAAFTAAVISTSLAYQASNAEPFVPVVDDLIAAGETPLAFWDSAQRVNSSYTGNILRIRRSSDNVETDIGYDEDNTTDEAAIVAHCTGTDCFAVTLEDQSGNNRDVTMATAARQPKVYDATAGVLKLGELVALEFTGASGTTSTRLARGDASGLSGAVPLTHFSFLHQTTSISFTRMITAFGGTTALQHFAAGAGVNTGLPSNNISQSNSFRIFTATNVFEPHYTVHRVGGTIGSSTMRRDGVDLAQSSVGAGSANSATYATTSTTIGSYLDGSLGMTGRGTSWALLEEDASGAVLTALEDYGAELAELSRDAVVAVTGQSNALNLPLASVQGTGLPGWQWKIRAQNASAISQWVEPNTLYTAFVDVVASADPDRPVATWWIQGEQDCEGGLGAVYEDQQDALQADVEEDSGRSDLYWLVGQIHGDQTTGTAQDRADVRAAKVAFVSRMGADAILIDPTYHGTLTDGVHWSSTLQTNMMDIARDAIRVKFEGVTNVAPTVTAPADTTAFVGGGVTLDATCTDADGVGNLACLWTKTSGSGDCTFTADAATVDVTIDCDAADTYVFTLTGRDGLATSSDTISIVFYEERLLDQLSIAANNAYSVSDLLRNAYAGSAYEAQRHSDDTTLGIGFEASGDVDTAALATFCSGTTCSVRTLYDQSSNGRDLTQTTRANQPTVYTGGAVVVRGTVNVPSMSFDGTDYLARGDSSGLTGNPAITYAFNSLCTNTAADNITMLVGTSNVGAGYGYIYFPAVARPVNSIFNALRSFNHNHATSTWQYFISSKASAADIGSSTLEQDGTALTQNSVLNGTNTPTLATTNTSIGASHSGTFGLTGAFSTGTIFNDVLAGDDLTATRAWFGARN